MKTILSEKCGIILIGNSISVVSKECKRHFNNRKCFIVTDRNVGSLWLDKIVSQFNNDGIVTYSHIIESGEQYKNFSTLNEIIEMILGSGCCRDDYILALGGGVVGDITGLAAALCLRGIPVVQVPTTLLAMVDSSVGGKTAIDTKFGKNSVGVFYQPELVICCTEFLSTLPKEEFANGCAEIIKYGLIADKTIFETMNNESVDLSNGEIINKCLQIKIDVVEKDEKDKGLRRILNFGHTFGHAIELLSDYSIPHGVAVAKGMVLAAEESVKRGLIDFSVVESIKECCRINNLDTTVEFSKEELLASITNDKKRDIKGINFVFLKSIGETEIDVF